MSPSRRDDISIVLKQNHLTGEGTAIAAAIVIVVILCCDGHPSRIFGVTIAVATATAAACECDYWVEVFVVLDGPAGGGRATAFTATTVTATTTSWVKSQCLAEQVDDFV